jgi:cell division transport system permease protein
MPMPIRMLVYVWQESFRSLKRNGWLNFAAAGTTAVSLFILGIAILLVINTNSISRTVESDVEIRVYVNLNVVGDHLKSLQQQIEMIPGVNSVQFISKAEALRSLSAEFGKDSKLIESLMLSR